MSLIDPEGAAQSAWDRWLPHRTDIEARNQIVALYLPTVCGVVEAYMRRHRSVPWSNIGDDVHQAAALALVGIVAGYIPDRGPFEPFMRAKVVHAVQDHLRTYAGTPRAQHGERRRARDHVDSVVNRSGVQRPTAESVAAAAEVPVPVAQAELDRVYGAHRSDNNRFDLVDSRHPNPADIYEVNQVGLRVSEGVAGLPVEYRKVLALRFSYGMRMSGIARLCACSTTTVSAMIDKAIGALEDQLVTGPVPVPTVRPGFADRVAVASSKMDLSDEQWIDDLVCDVSLLGAVIRDLVRRGVPGRRGDRAVPDVADGLRRWGEMVGDVDPETNQDDDDAMCADFEADADVVAIG